MVFFKALVDAGKIALCVALLAILLSSIGIQLFSSALISIPGFILFYFLLVFFVVWVRY